MALAMLIKLLGKLLYMMKNCFILLTLTLAGLNKIELMSLIDVIFYLVYEIRHLNWRSYSADKLPVPAFTTIWLCSQKNCSLSGERSLTLNSMQIRGTGVRVFIVLV